MTYVAKYSGKHFCRCLPSTLLPERIYLDTLVSCLVISANKEQYILIAIYLCYIYLTKIQVTLFEFNTE